MMMVFSTGLMAEKLGSYVPAFYMVGGVMIFGSLVPFLLYWLKEETSDTSYKEDDSELKHLTSTQNQ